MVLVVLVSCPDPQRVLYEAALVCARLFIQLKKQVTSHTRATSTTLLENKHQRRWLRRLEHRLAQLGDLVVTEVEGVEGGELLHEANDHARGHVVAHQAPELEVHVRERELHQRLALAQRPEELHERPLARFNLALFRIHVLAVEAVAAEVQHAQRQRQHLGDDGVEEAAAAGVVDERELGELRALAQIDEEELDALLVLVDVPLHVLQDEALELRKNGDARTKLLLQAQCVLDVVVLPCRAVVVVVGLPVRPAAADAQVLDGLAVVLAGFKRNTTPRLLGRLHLVRKCIQGCEDALRHREPDGHAHQGLRVLRVRARALAELRARVPRQHDVAAVATIRDLLCPLARFGCGLAACLPLLHSLHCGIVKCEIAFQEPR